jgi:hypothetical protein
MPTTYRDLPATSGPIYLDDSASAHIWTGQQSARVAWYVSYGKLNDFINTVFGRFETIVYTYGSMVRRVPMQHPRYPALVADNVSYKAHSGFDFAANTVFDVYETIEVTVDFSIPPYAFQGGNPFMSMTRTAATEWMTIPNSSLKYDSDGKPIQQDVAIPVPVADLQVVLHGLRVPIPPGLVTAEASPLNSTAFHTPWGDYPTGTVVLLSNSQSTQIYQGTLPAYECTIHFKARPSLRWDYRLREDTGAADKVVKVGGGDLMAMSDLNTIFNF